jgi:hypothetical protein
MFIRPIAEIIAAYLATFQLSKWIQALGFETTLSKNIIHSYLSSNPMAMHVICHEHIDWLNLCENSADWAVDLILANRDKISWYHLSHNKNPRAFALVKEYVDSKTDDDLIAEEIDEMLSTNPLALHLLQCRPRLIDKCFLMWNPEAEEFIKNHFIPLEYLPLAMNDAPWAAKLLLAHGIHLLYETAICRNKNPDITAAVLSIPEKIDWEGLCSNRTAIDYLRTNPLKICLTIYENPAIFELSTSHELVTILLNI